MELTVEHTPSRRLGENWNGVVEKDGRWRQLGVFTANGLFTFNPMPELPGQLKLTDTCYGQSIVVETSQVLSYVRNVGDELEFLGRPIQRSHIHVAYRQ